MSKLLVILCLNIFGIISLVNTNDEGMCMAPSSENQAPDCGSSSETP